MKMGYDLELTLKRINGAFVCILDGKTEEFACEEEFKNSDFEKRCEIVSIETRDEKIVLELKKLPLKNDLNAEWIQEHIKQYGKEPSFF